MSEPFVFLALPSRGHSLAFGASGAIGEHHIPSEFLKVYPLEISSTILEHGFNMLWAAALNGRSKYGFTHFAMLHDDIVPERFWLDIAMGEMERLGADLISAVVRIKNDTGLTSTAIQTDDPWISRRLTMKEIAALPETFCSDDTDSPDRVLLVNTGCMLIDLRKSWVNELLDGKAEAAFKFEIRTRIVKQQDGRFAAQLQSEDWLLSKHLASIGAKVYATRKIKAKHVQMVEEYFDNEAVEGQETDNLVLERLGAAA